MITGEQIHLVGWIITFIVLSILYVRSRQDDEIPFGDIVACCLIFLISGIWFVFIPLIAIMLFCYVWIKLLMRIFGK